MTDSTKAARNTSEPTRLAVIAICLTAWIVLTVNPAAALAQCEPRWGPLSSGVDRQVFDMEVFDDGTGPALYVAGIMENASGVIVRRIAKWDGFQWSDVGGGLIGRVDALAIFDDGTGESLYAAPREEATAAAQIQLWANGSWNQVGGDIDGTVLGMQGFDDGSGTALFATGQFSQAGGSTASNIARWDGQQWSGVSGGLTGGLSITSGNGIAVFDDGSGPALFVGGDFRMAGSTPASNIAKWDGTEWSALGSGLQGGGHIVRTLTVADLGNGPKLYVGGRFLAAGGIGATSIAVWDGAEWAPMGDGLRGTVQDITVFDDGTGPALYAAGDFSSSGLTTVNGVARWDGSAWQPVDGGVSNTASALQEFSGTGSVPSLIVGGAFANAGANAARNVARYIAPTPLIIIQPSDRSAKAGNAVSFSVAVTSTPGPYSVQWRKDGLALTDQPPRLTGTRALTLRINPVDIGDAGLYDAIITNKCGSTMTRPARLDVTYKYCYADCDKSTGPRVLDIFDFLCFQNEFARFESYADCDGNELLDIFDFLCFQDAFVSGCP